MQGGGGGGQRRSVGAFGTRRREIMRMLHCSLLDELRDRMGYVEKLEEMMISV